MPDDAKPLRRTAILDSAEAQFAQHGYDGVNLRAMARPNPPSVEAIVRAYLRPLLTGSHVTEPGWKHYYALIAYVNNSPEWGGKLMTQFFDPLINQFIDALRLSLGNADEKALFWSYHCFSGALTLTFAETGRIDQLSKGLCRSDDLDGAYEHVVRFITAGFESIRPDA